MSIGLLISPTQLLLFTGTVYTKQTNSGMFTSTLTPGLFLAPTLGRDLAKNTLMQTLELRPYLAKKT